MRNGFIILNGNNTEYEMKRKSTHTHTQKDERTVNFLENHIAHSSFSNITHPNLKIKTFFMTIELNFFIEDKLLKHQMM